MAAPAYDDSSCSSLTSPPYRSFAAEDERVLELRRPLAPPLLNLPDEYVFQSKHISLELGARTWPTNIPCYGYTAIVAGTIHLLSLDYVKQVNITVRFLGFLRG